MKLNCDIHTHTIASGHAYGTMREMAAEAAARGISLIGFSEHGPGTPGTCDPFHFAAIDKIPRTLHGVHVIHGCEINVMNDGVVHLEKRWLKKLDYAIVGIHSVCFKNEGAEKNTEQLIACMKHPKVFFISHPDDSKNPLSYERLVQAAKEYHVALEVNNSSFLKESRLNRDDNYRTMLACCVKYQVPIIVSSDAHDPSWAGVFDNAIAFLEAEHFPEELILTKDEQRVLEFIGLDASVFR